MKSSRKKKLVTDDSKKIEELKLYIDANLHVDLTLPVLALIFGNSQSKLTRQFKRKYNVTLGHYILGSRMNKAKILLAESHLPVNEVAEIVGYKNRTSFTHSFSAFFGYSPFVLLVDS